MAGSIRFKKVLPALALVGLLVLVGVSIWVLLASCSEEEAPSGADWLEVAETVQGRFEEGEVVRIEPAWLTGARIFFGDLDGGEREPFRILDIHDPMDPPFLYHFKRVWLVTALDRRHDSGLIPPGGVVVDEVDFSKLTLQLVELPSHWILWDLVPSLGTARLQRFDKKGKPVSCRFRGRSFGCGNKREFNVGTELRQVAGGPRQCVVIGAYPDDQPAVLEFPQLPGPGVLRLTLGQTVEAARAGDGSETVVKILVGGVEVEQLHLIRRDYNLHYVEVPLTEGETSLVVEVTAEDSRRREVCLEGVVLDLDWASR